MRAILKSDKCEFNLNYKYAWFQTNIVWHKVQLQLIAAILKLQNSVSTNTIKFWPSSQFNFLKSGNKKVLSHFVPETEMMQYRAKMVWFQNRNEAI